MLHYVCYIYSRHSELKIHAVGAIIEVWWVKLLLWHQHSIWELVQILASPLSIYLSINPRENPGRWIKNSCPCCTHGKPKWSSHLLASTWSSPWDYDHLGSASVLSFSLLSCLPSVCNSVFQISKPLKKSPWC